MQSAINQPKNRINLKHDLSFVSALWASFMKIWPLLREGEGGGRVCMSLLGTGPNSVHRTYKDDTRKYYKNHFKRCLVIDVQNIPIHQFFFLVFYDYLAIVFFSAFFRYSRFCNTICSELVRDLDEFRKKFMSGRTRLP